MARAPRKGAGTKKGWALISCHPSAGKPAAGPREVSAHFADSAWCDFLRSSSSASAIGCPHRHHPAQALSTGWRLSGEGQDTRSSHPPIPAVAPASSAYPRTLRLAAPRSGLRLIHLPCPTGGCAFAEPCRSGLCGSSHSGFTGPAWPRPPASLRSTLATGRPVISLPIPSVRLRFPSEPSGSSLPSDVLKLS